MKNRELKYTFLAVSQFSSLIEIGAPRRTTLSTNLAADGKGQI